MMLPRVLDGLAEFGVHDRASLFVFARRLREASIMSPSKKGRGATDLDASDVSSLALAALGTTSPGKAPETVMLTRAATKRSTSLHPSSELRVLNQALSAPTFGEAFDALISHGAELREELAQYVEERITVLAPPVEMVSDLRARLLDVTVSVMGPRRRHCRIDLTEVLQFGELDGRPVIELAAPPYARRLGNLWVSGKDEASSQSRWTFGSTIHIDDVLRIATLAEPEIA